MFIDFLREIFRTHSNQDAVVWQNKVTNYGRLEQRLDHWLTELRRREIPPGATVALEADFSPESLAVFLALVEHRCILTPLSAAVGPQREKFIRLAGVEYSLSVQQNDQVEFSHIGGNSVDHPLYSHLRGNGHPGLVLFTSGSTGESKAAVHDFSPLLEKFQVFRPSFRTIAFLLFDHIGGINTMFHTLAGGGCLVTLEQRDPNYVMGMIEHNRAELLPTSPTFLNLVLLSEAYRDHDLSSLKLITYGTEPMPQSTLGRIHSLWPQVKLSQTYGLTEVGILRAHSRSSDSLWVKVGGEGFETRVKEGRLQIKARSSMLGYLNAPSPFTADGWLDTGDLVEVDGEYIRFLGRHSELINVGGEKVFPAEVENVILELDNVAEALVHGERNPITGNIVCATVRLMSPEQHREFAVRLKCYVAGRLERYKVPVRVRVVDRSLSTGRFKKDRFVV